MERSQISLVPVVYRGRLQTYGVAQYDDFEAVACRVTHLLAGRTKNPLRDHLICFE